MTLPKHDFHRIDEYSCSVIRHYSDVIMSVMVSQITSLTIYSGTDQRKQQSSTSLAFVWGIHRSPVNSPHKWPVTWKMFPFDDVIMTFDSKLLKLIKAWCVIYVSMTVVIIISGNGFLSSQEHTITWINAKLLEITSLGTNFIEI